ncbi:LysM peptidoglycan-binding domain-containing protein [Aeromicrobium duanguangcaii]|uniref:LysM peptidoglycan-binding domain-containing protein n=1 Tax=Aeromicrobium duanguangcaii TaxID=2968086 RepID=A0ABY5KJL6_9ACTN|nr:LysM domain-containing protein [Aeromicrobium duanguangcaii]MCD9153579.1 LysM peptidoglycan-binding domain-containing protein [Aeromicrobium duanguangcaii]UUI69337.1 LysM peptidoglycan-binding domain-containing protein [Aeromicrobium duanguangcaii]
MDDLSTLGWETALRWLLAAVLAVWVLWWLLGLALALIDRRLAARLGPPLLRALLVTGAVVATATPARAGSPQGALDGLALPERPLTQAPTAHRSTPPAAEVHVVVAGESLWSIVRDHSPGADDDATVAEVARWHHANRDVIGPDPDLIHPGQRLDPPGAR